MARNRTVTIRSTRRRKETSSEADGNRDRMRLTVVTRAISAGVVCACIAGVLTESAPRMGFPIRVPTTMACVLGGMIGIVVGGRSGWLQDQRVVRMEEAAARFGMKPIGGTRWIRDELRELHGLQSDIWKTSVENAFVKDFGRAKYAVCDFRRFKHGLFQRDKRSRLRTVAVFRFDDGTSFPSFQLRCLAPLNRNLGRTSSTEANEVAADRYVLEGEQEVERMFTSELRHALADCPRWEVRARDGTVAVSWKGKLVRAKDIGDFFPAAFRLCKLVMACTAQKPSTRGS